MGMSLLVGVVEIDEAPFQFVYKIAEFLSNVVLLWRFFCVSTSKGNYLKISILEKREVRARMILSILLITQAVCLVLFSRKGEYIVELSAWRYFLMAFFLVIFSFFKIKYAVDFRSRVLQMGAYISLMNCLMLTFRFMVSQNNTMTQFESLFYMFLGCYCGYFGFFVFLVCVFEYDAYFWKISWWITDSKIVGASEVMLQPTADNRHRRRRLSEISFPGLQPATKREEVGGLEIQSDRQQIVVEPEQTLSPRGYDSDEEANDQLF